MATKYTREERHAIVLAHMEQSGGKFVPEEFVEVARADQHPAHDWFTWDDSVAAQAHRIWQARNFAKIRVVKPAEEEHDLSTGNVEIRYQPAFVSPPNMRTSGGGYVSTDSEEGKNALLDEAAEMLRQWYFRFGAVLDLAQDKAARSLLRKFPEAE